MNGMNEYDHFEGKKVAEHLRVAREKGAKATSEVHGTELPGYLSAFGDSFKEWGFYFHLFIHLHTSEARLIVKKRGGF